MSRLAMIVLVFLSAGLSLLMLASAPSMALSATKNWYVDDGCKVGLSDDNYFFAEGDGTGYQIRQGGYGNCYMTLIAFWPGTNYVEWYLPVNDPAYQGLYTNNAYVNSSVQPLTSKAKYSAFANGHAGGVSSRYWLNQQIANGPYCWKLWNETYGNGGLVRLIKKTRDAERDTTTFIVIDLFCFVVP